MHIRKLGKSILIVFLALSITVFMHQNVYAGYLGITRFAQEKTNWCWAACAKMVGYYYGNNYSQSSICIHVKGSNVNETASLSEVASAIHYTTDAYITTSGVWTLNNIKSDIDDNQPLVIRMQWNDGGGHAVVVGGYTQNYLRIIDPSGSAQTTAYTYSSLVSGTTIQSGTGYYSNTWSLNFI